MPRLLRLVFFCVALFTLAACGGGGRPAGLSAPGLRDASRGFAVTVDPASFVDGGSAEDIYLTRDEYPGYTVISVGVESASGLKALYLDLDYDAEQYRPLTAEPTAAMGARPDILNLQFFQDRGTVHYGQVLSSYEWRTGMSGDGVVARIQFAHEACPQIRVASAAPPVGATPALSFDEPASTLQWLYSVKGDYDQNGEINASDLTPLGLHFGKQGPFAADSIEAQVDGDGNGEINLADISVIGLYFKATVEGYRIFESTDPGAAPSEGVADQQGSLPALAEVGVSSGTPNGSGRRQFQFAVAEPQLDAVYWVRPYLAQSEGARSALADGIDSPPLGGLANPPAEGDGLSASTSYVVRSGGSYVFTVIDTDDGDVSHSPLTTYVPSSAAIGVIDSEDATMVIPDDFVGEFHVDIEYDGEGSSPPRYYFRSNGGGDDGDLTLSLDNPPAAGDGSAANPYVGLDSDSFDFTVTHSIDGDVSLLSDFTVTPVEAGSIAAGERTLDVVDGFTGDFTVGATYDGMTTEPEALYFKIYDSEGPPTLVLASPPATGDGSIGNPYVVDNNQVLTFIVFDPMDGDVSSHPDTIFSESVDAGSFGPQNVYTVNGTHAGSFSVSASFDGVPTVPNSMFFTVIHVPKLLIAPDPADADWPDVPNFDAPDAGSSAVPYIMHNANFNPDADSDQVYDIEFSCVASVDGSPVDNETLTWGAGPVPFCVIGINEVGSKGSFRVNVFTNGYVFAQDESLTESNRIYVICHDTLGS